MWHTVKKYDIKEELNKYADLVGSIRILSAVSISAANEKTSCNF